MSRIPSNELPRRIMYKVDDTSDHSVRRPVEIYNKCEHVDKKSSTRPQEQQPHTHCHVVKLYTLPIEDGLRSICYCRMYTTSEPTRNRTHKWFGHGAPHIGSTTVKGPDWCRRLVPEETPHQSTGEVIDQLVQHDA